MTFRRRAVAVAGCFVTLLSFQRVTRADGLDDPVPALAGTYVASSAHPRVFLSRIDLDDLVRRIALPDSFSAKKFLRLATVVGSDVAADVDWNAAYSGCDLDVYLHTFSIEETRGYATDVRSLAQIRAALGLSADVRPPLGAAVVASRSALYAALVEAGAVVPPGAPSSERAANLAERILTAWTRRGFRDRDGRYRRTTIQFCEQSGAVTPASRSAVGLQISRGVSYSVYAQDLLQSFGRLRPSEEKQLDAFHDAMYALIRDGLNDRFASIHMPCDRFSNHVASQLTGLLATARLLDDRKKFLAALYGRDRAVTIELPWATYFSKAIYGERQQPNRCLPDNGSDGATFNTPTVASGEIDDRFRNATPLQGIGYAMGTLEYLFAAADILSSAGFDAYGYRGSNRQSIERATQYYACYARSAGFTRTVSTVNSATCPNHEQYVGKVVNDVAPSILMGASRFPKDPAVTAVEEAAKNASLQDGTIDAIRFGRWTN